MKKPKYFKGAKKKQKPPKEPVAEKSARKQLSSKAELPKNSRSIPETPLKKHKNPWKIPGKFHFPRRSEVWLHVWNIVAIILLLLLAYGMVQSLQELRQKNLEREALQVQRNKWEAVVKQYPNYRDAYLRIAAFSYQLGDQNQAIFSLTKAISLDPNNETALHLEEMMVKKKK
jgi:tetratricopeptide (TPR) repeat protein